MSRISAMTIGMVLIFIGAQLFLIKSYLLTPTATRFVHDHFSASSGSRFSGPNQGVLVGDNGSGSGNNYSLFRNSSSSPTYAGQSWPFYRTSGAGNNGVFQNSSFNGGSATFPATIGPAGRQRFVPPSWIKWPVLFLGAVFFLHGAALRS